MSCLYGEEEQIGWGLSPNQKPLGWWGQVLTLPLFGGGGCQMLTLLALPDFPPTEGSPSSLGCSYCPTPPEGPGGPHLLG